MILSFNSKGFKSRQKSYNKFSAYIFDKICVILFTFPSSATTNNPNVHLYSISIMFFISCFLDFMMSVFGDSQRTLHDTFMQTYGHLYEKNSDLFEDFFKELRRYYERGNDNLFEITNKLFSKLYKRMFQVSSYA